MPLSSFLQPVTLHTQVLELMSILPRGHFQSPGRTSSHHVSLAQFSGDLVELLPASGSALVMSDFMYQMHSATRLSSTVSQVKLS